MTRFHPLICGVLALGGCGSSDDSAEPAGGTPGGLPTGTTVGTTTTGTPTGTTTGGTTSTTGRTGPEIVQVDCTQLLPLPLTATTHTWVPSHENFTFGTDGLLYGTFGGNLHGTPYGGPNQVVVPGTGDARGTKFLSDGTLVLARTDDQTIVKVDPVSGSVTNLTGSLTNPNGIAIDWQDRIHVATTGQILRIDPDTGDTEVIVDMGNHSFDGVAFSVDYTRLYFNEEIGRIWWVDFDADGNPGNPVQGPDLPIGAFSILDGMTVDACDNLYVVEMGGKLWRVSGTDGSVELALDLPPGAFVPAVQFAASDLGGWSATAVYVNDFLGRIYEAEVGVPGKWEPHHGDL